MKEMSWFEFCKRKFKQNRKKDKNELTTDEALKYVQLRRHEITFPISILVFPFYGAFYLGLFTLVMRYAFNVELLKPMLKLVAMIFQLWIPALFAFMVVMILITYQNMQSNKRLRDKIIGERK